MINGDSWLPQQEAAAVFHESGNPSQLEMNLGHEFSDSGLLRRALTHPSLAGEKNYQRLEFLGDAVLQLCISQELYLQSKKHGEGHLTRRRQQLVCEAALARVARSLELGNHLRIHHSLKRDGGTQLDSVLADAMEAIIAAVYLDAGLDAAANMIRRLWQQEFKQSDASLDAKGALQAHLAMKSMSRAVYHLIKEEGPTHKREYTVQVEISGKILAQGQGSSKKAAELAAAKEALRKLMEGENT